MLSRIKTLKDISILSKEEQGKIKAGMSGICKFTFVLTDGSRDIGYRLTDLDGSAQSTEASGICAGAVALNSVSRCFYDCSHDGIG